MIRRVDDVGEGARSGRPEADESSVVERERAETIVTAARRVLEIVPGERRLLPEFGCRIHRLETLDGPRDRGLAAALIEEALERWVPELGVARAEVWPAARAGWIRVALRVSHRWHEFEIKHRGERTPPPREVLPLKPSHREREEPTA